MNIEELREYCLRKPNSFDCFPFDEDTLVFKVVLKNGKDKMFALISLSNANYVLLKCNPERAVELREQYEEIEPGYHCNKKHWNGVFLDRTLSRKFIEELIDHSYELVAKQKSSV